MAAMKRLIIQIMSYKIIKPILECDCMNVILTNIEGRPCPLVENYPQLKT